MVRVRDRSPVSLAYADKCAFRFGSLNEIYADSGEAKTTLSEEEGYELSD